MTATALMSGASLRLQGLTPLANVNLGTITIPLNNAVLYDDGQGHQITANGSISLTPGLVFTVSIGFFSIKQVTFAITGNETADISLSSPIAEANLDKKVPVYAFYFQPTTVFIGVVPVVIIPKVTVYVGLNGSVSIGLSTGITQTANLIGGLDYNNGLYNLINNVSNNFQFNPPIINANANLKVYGGPEMEVFIDGVIGPTAEIDGYLELSADILSTPWWILYGGLEGTVGLKAKILSYTLDDYTAQIFNLQSLIAQSNSSGNTQNTPPMITGLSVAPSPIRPGGSAIAVVTANDPDGDALTYSWLINSSTSGWNIAGNGPTATISSPNASFITATVSVIVEDGHGNKVSSSINIKTGIASNTITLGTVSAPQGIAIDSSGNVWVSNTYNTGGIINPVIYELNSNGTIIGTYNMSSCSGYPTGGNSIAIDSTGNIWDAGGYGITVFNAYGTVIGQCCDCTRVSDIAISNSGNVWYTTIGYIYGYGYYGYVDELSPSNSYAVGSYPQGIAIDSSGNIWVANSSSNNVTEISASGIIIGTYSVGSSPQGIAIDSSGNIWVANSGSNSLTKLSASGVTIGTYTAGTNPCNIAIDASGNVWVTNCGSSSYVTEINSSGVVIGTYSVGKNPTGIAIDTLGNVWVANTGSGSVTELVGAAKGPQYFPYSGPVWPW
jgi:streptogramin lyase